MQLEEDTSERRPSKVGSGRRSEALGEGIELCPVALTSGGMHRTDVPRGR